MSDSQCLEDVARAMVAAADRVRAVVPVMRSRCPHVYRQIVRDRQYPGLFAFWGRCVNEDENARETIVHPAILAAIGELAGVPMRGRVVHAGLQHTYGYLFSLIDTPYGAKRDRWVSTDLEEGFGLEPSLLGDRPREGTLLANATWFLAKTLYRGRPSSSRRFERIAQAVAPALIDYDYARLRPCRLVEEVSLTEPVRTELRLITDLVPFPQTPADRKSSNTLLVYSVQQGNGPRRLISAFPVTQQVVQKLRTSVAPGEVDVRLKYNAHVRGLAGCSVPGRRFLIEAND